MGEKLRIFVFILALFGLLVIISHFSREYLLLFMFITFLIALFTLPEKIILYILIFMIPFSAAFSYLNTTVYFIYLFFIRFLIGDWKNLYSIKLLWKNIKKRFRRTPLDIPILLLIVAYLLSFINASKTNVLYLGIFPVSIHVLEFVRILSFIVFYYLIVNLVKTDKQRFFLIKLSIITCVIASFYALFQIFFPNVSLIPYFLNSFRYWEFHSSGLRAGSSFHNYELFAEYVVLNIMFALHMYFSKRKALYLWVLVLFSFCLPLTGTRAGPIILLFGLFLFFAFAKKLSIDKKRFMRVVAIILIVFLTSALVMPRITLVASVIGRFSQQKEVIEKLKEIREQALLEESDFDDSLDIGSFLAESNLLNREKIWFDSFREGLEHPIIGKGPRYIIHLPIIQPHSVYLHYFIIIGTLGLLAFLLILFILLRISFFSSLFKRQGRLQIILGIVLVIFLVDQLKISCLFNENYGFFVWFLFGLIAICFKTKK